MKIKIWLYQQLGGMKKSGFSPAKLIALAFMGIILVGTMLLALPAASRSGVSCGFVPALFTATSATCVTGLSLYDTWSQWTGFGQTVILLLIQIGGLGFMSSAALVVFLLRRRVGLKQRLVMAQALSVNDMDSVVHLQKTVLVGSFGVEAVGALLLTLRFLPQYGLRKALAWGVFHAISAFCNAGFDIFGSLQPGGSLMPFQNDPVVLLIIGALIVIGGLGFFVWEEIVRLHSFRRFSVYTKLVLVMTGSLLLAGALCFVALEWNNPLTLGQMQPGQKLLNALFQSVTTRTAGFASIDQSGLTDGGKAVTMVLMLIGGSSGSTAGGIKTVTVVVLLLSLWTRARGRANVTVFKRTIPAAQVVDAMTISGIVITLAFFGAVVICVSSSIGLTDALYESVSALATVGLTAGATGKLSLLGRLLMIVYMYFGRVGVLTISLGFLVGNQARERYQYAQTNLLIG